MDSKTVNKLYEKLKRSLPDSKPELNFQNRFELLLAVMLSAQATDKSVNKVTAKLFPKYSNPEAIVKCGQSRLQKMIKTIGLAPTKAKNIVAACKILIDEHNGEPPGEREALERLPGVGRKTANVVLNEGFGQPTIAVDTHVFRLANRSGLAPGKNVEETEQKLLNVTPKKWLQTAHRYLILHGRYVCTARNFKCGECAIKNECQYPEKLL